MDEFPLPEVNPDMGNTFFVSIMKEDQIAGAKLKRGNGLPEPKQSAGGMREGKADHLSDPSHQSGTIDTLWVTAAPTIRRP